MFWLQDLHSVAMAAEAEKRAGRLGRQVGTTFEALERRLLRQADGIVSITDDFRPVLDGWGVDGSHCTVIENWAPLSDLPERHRHNGWRAEHGLGDRFVYLYTGTLGLKHRPELLYQLAEQRAHDSDVVVVSEGMGEQRLREMLREPPAAQPTAAPLPADGALPRHPGGGRRAGRPARADGGHVLRAVQGPVVSVRGASGPGGHPAENLAARTIERAGAGLVVSPTDEEAFLVAAKRLRVEDSLRNQAGRAARAYAEITFDTDRITDRFETVIDRAVARRAGVPFRRKET